MSKAAKLKIGDTLYRHVVMSGIWMYTVIGVREYEDNTQYEVRCESCSHGSEKCRLLIAENEKGVYKYVSHLNYDEDDDQSYWHNDANYSTFHANKYSAHIDAYKKMLSDMRSKVEEAKKNLAYRQKVLDETSAALKLAEQKYNASIVEVINE